MNSKQPAPARRVSIPVVLPYALQRLADCPARLELAVAPPITQRRIVRALEARYPELSGAVFDHVEDRRRPKLRFFAGREDLSRLDPDDPLPEGVAEGRDEFIIVGAISGG